MKAIGARSITQINRWTYNAAKGAVNQMTRYQEVDKVIEVYSGLNKMQAHMTWRATSIYGPICLI